MRTIFWVLAVTLVTALTLTGYASNLMEKTNSRSSFIPEAEYLLHKVSLTWMQLPVMSRKYISDHFSGCRIEEMNEVKTPKSDKIEVLLFKDHYKYDLLFNKNGELLKQIKHSVDSQ